MALDVRVQGLTSGYGSTVILRDVSLEIESGSALAVIGRNGMGKTTLLRALLGYLGSTKGSVEIGGKQTRGMPTYRIVRSRIAYAPQDDALFGELTIRDNLAGVRRPSPQTTKRLAQIYEYFPILSERLDQKAGTLSGGEQKMLVLARSLLADPELLVIDEISDGLQPRMINVVRDILLEERRVRGTTLLIVEQNIDLGFAVSDQIAVLKLGTIAFRCPPEPDYRPQIIEQLAP